MTFKYILFLFCIIIFSFFCYLKKDYFFEKKYPVEYVNYDDILHKNSLDELMEKNQFWLFHGNFQVSRDEIYSNIVSQIRKNDFDFSSKVKYYTKIAIINNIVVGFITYYICSFIEEGAKLERKIGRIHLLTIDSDYRRHGIAMKLVCDVLDFFKSNNCIRAYLATRPENIRAKSLYYKLGFVESEKNDFVGNFYDNNPADFLIKDL